MKIINCNKNKELAAELAKQLVEYSAVQEDDRIYVTKEITTSVLESQIKETGRPQHGVFYVYSDNFVVALPQDL